ncbi:hypothetical protein GCM10028807_11410 [Spirosoma daeguense]
MKAKQIRFFSPEENSEEKKKEQKSATKAAPVTGYISTGGKLVFPDKSAAQLGFDPESNRYKVGTQDGKRKIKSLYLVPDSSDQGETFELVKAAKSHAISLPFILQKGGIDYANVKYSFTVKSFEYDNGVTGYELKLSDNSPKPEYTGKPRGRKRQNPVAE